MAGEAEGGGCLPSGSHPAGQWQTHSTGNTVALWPPSVLVEVGILPANKGINPQGILGIFTFGNGEEVVVGGAEKNNLFSVVGIIPHHFLIARKKLVFPQFDQTEIELLQSWTVLISQNELNSSFLIEISSCGLNTRKTMQSSMTLSSSDCTSLSSLKKVLEIRLFLDHLLLTRASTSHLH